MSEGSGESEGAGWEENLPSSQPGLPSSSPVSFIFDLEEVSAVL